MIRCVYGPPGSGKSTYVSDNANENDIIFDYDKMLTAISTKSNHAESTEDQHHMIMSLRFTFLRLAHELESDIWFIVHSLTDDLREKLGDKCEYIELTATKEELYDRVDNDDSRPDKDFEHQKIDNYFDEDRGATMNENREFRSMEMRILPGDHEKSYLVEGYAATFDPYVLLTIDGVDYSERIDPHAFDEADMSDVVFRFDHEGAVFARTSAGTVTLDIDPVRGLHNVTDLSRTARSRAAYDEIEAGNYPQMSFAFTVADGGDEYDRDSHTRIINRIAKVYDISPVSFPANPMTSVGVKTRDWFDGVIEAEKAERLEREERERQKQRIRILTEVNK